MTHTAVDEPDTFDMLHDLAPEYSEGATELYDEADDKHGRPGLALFEGDISTLFFEQRACLLALLKLHYISADQHPDHWAVLLSNEEVIKGRLNDLFLDLHIDRDHRVAFKRSATPEGNSRLPSLLRNVSHSKEETIVMVSLRRRFFTQRQQGDFAVFVDRQTLVDEVADHRPPTATDRFMDNNRASNAIDGLAKAGVLLRTDDPDRFRISPIVEVLLPIEKLRALWTWLITNNGTDDSSQDDDDPAPEDDELGTLFGTDGDTA
jgi:hypothetical protein